MAIASDVNTCVTPAHGPTNEGHSTVANILTAAAIAAAAYNSVRAVELATKEWNMAKKYWRIAQNWLDYYKDWFAPVEDQELDEAMQLQDEQPEYDSARGRARVTALLEFRGVLQQALRCTSRYCTGLRQDMLADISAAAADAVVLADGMGYRNERAYIESRADVRFDKQFNTAKRGRDMVADNVSLAKTSAGIYGDLFDQAWSGLTGAGEYLGYWNNRNETRFPTTYLRTRAMFQRAASGEDSTSLDYMWPMRSMHARPGPDGGT